MSTWNLGIGDVSEETHAFRNKLSSKDGHIAAQQTQLMRQAAEMDELRATLNDALHKLSHETTRALQLESDLHQRSEDLRNEKVASQNVGNALAAAHERIKAKDLEARDLQAILESLSHTSDGHNARSSKLEREKSILEMRVREMEVELRQIPLPPVTPGRRGAVSRPRSSSLSNFRVTALEQELNDVRASLSQKETELRAANQKLSHVQIELVRIDNEKLAVERKATKDSDELKTSLEEKEEELEYMRGQQGDGSREEELLQRIEEDEAKILALEKLARDAHDLPALRDRLQRVEQRLKEELEKANGNEERNMELVGEKEEALDELEDAREQLQKLDAIVNERDSQINALKERLSDHSKHTNNVDDMDCDDSVQPTPTASIFHPPTDEATVEYVERLLGAVDRLRGERDNLRRNVQFLESESRFAINALEAKLSLASSVSSASEHSLATVGQMKAEMDGLHAQLVDAAVRHKVIVRTKDRQIKHLGLVASASAVAVGHLQSQVHLAGNHYFNACVALEQAQSALGDRQEASKELEERLKELEVKVEVTVLCLETTTDQRNDLVSQLNAKDSEWEEELEQVKTAHRDTRDHLERVEVHLEEVSKTLEDVETERDSLALQVANITSDLHTAEQDLANAESRYSALQFHQLSSMSSNEANRAFRSQVEELEMRVMRRTEQIGIHQHDIRRLETNLRLQEERLTEMTGELETLAEQKDAMVEDCADAREARDEAIARVEKMDMEVEILEGRVEEGETTMAALVGVVFETIGRYRAAIHASSRRARWAEGQLKQLSAEHKSTVQLLEEETSMRRALESQAESHAANVQQTVLALATSRNAFSKARQCVETLREERRTLRILVTDLEKQVNNHTSQTTPLTEQLEALRQEALDSIVRFDAQTAELETEISRLQQAISDMEVVHQGKVDDLVRSNQRLQTDLDEKDLLLASNNLEGELVQIKLQHVDELGKFQARLVEASSALEELQARHAGLEAMYQKALEESLGTKKDLEEQLVVAAEDLQRSNRQLEEVEQAHKTQTKAIIDLQTCLNATEDDAVKAKRSLDELETLHRCALDELAQAQKDQENHIARIASQSLAVQHKLESELADLQRKLEEQTQGLGASVQEVESLVHQLREQADRQARDQEAHDVEMHDLSERCECAEAARGQLNQELATVQGQLDQTGLELAGLQDEKVSLQQETTRLEAEIQRSISMGRYLESQVKDSERTIVTLTSELELAREDATRADKSGKAAEVNLSLQGAQHRREMMELHRELTLLRSKPNLENVIAELEERNNEMEELLRNKCAEIEENDDRVLEMLKDNKKLTTKVESLTRKVQNMQAKLAAAKATIPKAAPELSQSTSSAIASPPIPIVQPASWSRFDTSTAVPPMPPIPPSATFSRAPLNRTVSGPSSLSRPKTPERRAVPPPVFKARTPERRSTPVVVTESMASTSSIGKKRPAPDDFEACEGVPVQGFTPDSVPGEEVRSSTTPRARRVLSSFQSGFTPVRNQGPRSMASIPSPKRLATGSARNSPLIADVTNSPRSSAKTSKRSWLGKIRGVSSTTGRPTSSRPMFDGDAGASS